LGFLGWGPSPFLGISFDLNVCPNLLFDFFLGLFRGKVFSRGSFYLGSWGHFGGSSRGISLGPQFFETLQIFVGGSSLGGPKSFFGKIFSRRGASLLGPPHMCGPPYNPGWG